MVEEDRRPEIIIVRRGGGGEEGHHGGAWKIAFADFMTAMMALFLVLWLVNAANEKTKKAVASYFNPVKLIDLKQSNRGLDEASGTGVTSVNKVQSNSDEEIPAEQHDGSEDPIKDQEFFEDPFAVMDGLAKVEQAKVENSDTSLVRAYLETVPSEDAFHDPFAQAVAAPPAVESNDKLQGESVPHNVESVLSKVANPVEGATEKKGTTEEEQVAENPADELPKDEEPADEQTDGDNQIASEKPHKQNEVEQNKDVAKLEKPEVLTPEQKKQDRAKQLEKMAAEILGEIKGKLKEKFGEHEVISDSLTVIATPEGVLISITDQLNFSMFQVGSAVPKGAIILAMEEISTVLKNRQGMVRVYGHTDARQYSGKGYDNWRLSTARSHSARLMLIRGGLDGPRISQVVGFADRRLRIPSAPQADANRRIEILLEVA